MLPGTNEDWSAQVAVSISEQCKENPLCKSAAVQAGSVTGTELSELLQHATPPLSHPARAGCVLTSALPALLVDVLGVCSFSPG